MIRGRYDIGLIDGLPVDLQQSVRITTHDAIAWQSNQTFDEMVFGIRASETDDRRNEVEGGGDEVGVGRIVVRQPTTRVAKHHNVTMLEREDVGDQFVDDDAVIHHQRVFHRCRRDKE